MAYHEPTPLTLNEMKEIWIIGAGRFGLLAVERLSAVFRGCHFIIVDPDKASLLRAEGSNRTLEQAEGVSFLDQRMHSPTAPDWIIPALPIHLAAEWCLTRLKIEGLHRIVIPFEVDPLVPNPLRGPGGDIFISHADFVCPDDCEEPESICTVTQENRCLDMYTLLGGIQIFEYLPLVIRSYQLGPGIGGYRPSQLFDLVKLVGNKENKYLLSTACRCHGVMTSLGYSS